ncbi:MAG: hypothetical protein GXP62_19505, partial [Oligoflexia bacterium]|nr:hypothetical protein [Oligoflexia bacterium]
GKFEEQLRDDMLRNKLKETVASGVSVSQAEVKDLYERTATHAKLTYVRILDHELAAKIVVDEPAIDEFLATSADQVTQAYERDKARLYSKPRKIGVHRLVMQKDKGGIGDADLRAKMDEIHKQAVEGADFEALVRRWSEDPTAETGGAAGLLAENIMEPQLASAALAVGAGKISEVIDTERSLILLSVDQIVDAAVTPIDVVKRDIARTLIAQQRATAQGGEQAEALLAAWKETGAAPTDLIASYGLALDQAGPFSPTESFVPGLGVVPALVKAVAELGGKGVLDGVYPIEGGRIVAAVTSWSGADPDRFEQLAPMIRAQLLQQKQKEVLTDWQQDLIASARVERLMRD